MENRNWVQTSLGTLVTIKHGWPFKSEFFTEKALKNPIVVSIGNFRYSGGFRFDSTALKGYTGDYPEEYALAPGDILLVMTCQTEGGEILGIPGRIPNDEKIYLHNQRMGKVVITRPSDVDENYLYWLFLSPDFNRHLTVTASGTKILHTSPSRIEMFHFSLPPLPEQRAIARILGSLDDKIELNRQMDKTLEAIAQAIFKSWFIDFDPVRAKMEGREPYGMDAETAALFPDGFEDSALGEIPRGWSVTRVGELISLCRDGLDPAKYPDEIFEHFSIPAFDEGRLPKKEASSLIKSNKYAVPPNAVLLSKLNPSIPRVWLPKVSYVRRSICSTEFIVALPKTNYSREFVYSVFNSPLFLGVFATLVTGTTGSHQRVQPENLLNMATVLPNDSLIARFTEIVRSQYELIAQHLEEISNLVAIRDTLLPKLISGQIRVKEAEKVVEAHV